MTSACTSDSRKELAMRRSLKLAFLLVAFVLGAGLARSLPHSGEPVAHAAPAAAVGRTTRTAASIPSTAAVQFVAEVPFPAGFEPYGGVEPSVFFARDGAHVVAAQGTYYGRKDLFGFYVFKWYPGRGAAVQLGVSYVTTGRGVLEIADRRLVVWAYEGTKLRIFQITDWISPDDAQNVWVP